MYVTDQACVIQRKTKF